jgi:hypothetical protein
LEHLCNNFKNRKVWIGNTVNFLLKYE